MGSVSEAFVVVPFSSEELAVVRLAVDVVVERGVVCQAKQQRKEREVSTLGRTVTQALQIQFD